MCGGAGLQCIALPSACLPVLHCTACLPGTNTSPSRPGTFCCCRRLVGDSEPGAALQEEGMGFSYQAFCIAQRGLQPWPFGAVISEDGNEEDEHEEEQPVIGNSAAVLEVESEQQQPSSTPPQ